jgi:hypothetical protein
MQPWNALDFHLPIRFISSSDLPSAHKFEDVPVFILIHLGGNDIGRIGLKDLRKKYKDEIFPSSHTFYFLIRPSVCT